jgi:hypothetical protein
MDSILVSRELFSLRSGAAFWGSFQKSGAVDARSISLRRLRRPSSSKTTPEFCGLVLEQFVFLLAFFRYHQNSSFM